MGTLFLKHASSFLQGKYKAARLAFTDVTEAQILTEEVTSGSPRVPDARIMSQIAKAAYKFDNYWRIVDVLHKRMYNNTDKKQWRVMYNSLILIDFLLTHGPEDFVDEFRYDHEIIEEYGLFEYVDDKGFDWGCYMRNKAQRILELLEGGEALEEARYKAIKLATEIRGFGSNSTSSINSSPQLGPRQSVCSSSSNGSSSSSSSPSCYLSPTNNNNKLQDHNDQNYSMEYYNNNNNNNNAHQVKVPLKDTNNKKTSSLSPSSLFSISRNNILREVDGMVWDDEDVADAGDEFITTQNVKDGGDDDGVVVLDHMHGRVTNTNKRCGFFQGIRSRRGANGYSHCPMKSNEGVYYDDDDHDQEEEEEGGRVKRRDGPVTKTFSEIVERDKGGSLGRQLSLGY